MNEINLPYYFKLKFMIKSKSISENMLLKTLKY